MKKESISWLLEGPGWIRYAVRHQLLEEKVDAVLALQDSLIRRIIKALKNKSEGISTIEYGEASYKGSVFWYLFFLADIGLTAEDIGMKKEIEGILNLQSSDGTFVVSKEMKPNYFCISAILLSSLVKMGYTDDKLLDKHLQIILDSQRLDGGWHCAKSRSVGKRLEQTESCPMDNLNLLMLLGQFERFRPDPRFNGAIDLLLSHWKKRIEKWRPYGFGVGSDYMKLKYPAIKYGILRVLDVLSLFPYAIGSQSFHSMLDFVFQKEVDGKYQAESIAKMFSEFDFGQKKAPSRWITFLIKRIEKRIVEY